MSMLESVNTTSTWFFVSLYPHVLFFVSCLSRSHNITDQHVKSVEIAWRPIIAVKSFSLKYFIFIIFSPFFSFAKYIMCVFP